MTKIRHLENRESDHFYFIQAFIKMVALPILVLGVLLLFLNFAQAEVVAINSPLTWRLDNLGEYSLPALSAGGVYATDQFVATKGQIIAITVNWESKGKIVMEVSADNGLNFTPVVNGVPLKNGFVRGDRIRWRAKALSDDAQLSAVKISYTDTSGIKGDFGEPLLSGYKYRKPFFVRNNSADDLYNFQMKIKIGESELTKGVGLNASARAKDDFSDIRFTAADAQTILPYYLENVEGESPNRIATVWVRIPQVPKESQLKLYLYYGNSYAESLSSGENTFDFFDDFKDASLNMDKWITYIEKNGSLQVNNGFLKLDAAEAITKEFLFKEGIVEYFCEVESGLENSLNLRNKNNNSYDIPSWVAYSSVYKGAEHCIAVDGIVKNNDAAATPPVAGGKYDYRLDAEGDNIIFERYDSVSKEKQASAAYKVEPALKEGYLSLRSGGDGNGKNTIYFGTVRVRKAASVEPVFDKAGKEEPVTLPVFVNTSLSAKGNLVLNPDAKSGYYIWQDISSGELTRILIPDWRVDSSERAELDVKISADKGESYKSGCEKGKFYYSSKNDFNAGTNLQVRVDLSRDSLFQASSGLSAISLDYRPGRVNVISPNGKEVWGAGTNKKITWSALDYESVYPFDIAYSMDAGKTYVEIIANKNNDGAYIWSVPDKASKRVRVKVSDSLDKSVFDTSDSLFSIIAIEPEDKADKATEALKAEKLKAEEKAKAAAEAEALDIDLERYTVDLNKLLEAGKRGGRQLYDVLIKLGDNVISDPEKDKGSYKEGDIIAIVPAGHKWSETERNSFLIVQLYLAENQVGELLQPKEISEGTDKDGNPITKMLRIRARGIDLAKFGLKPGMKNREAKLEKIKKAIKDKKLLQEE
ncbi:MAG: DUF2341 domain-containing protein [Candidatus Omnitrophota bacterium]|jgi:hypothetical protein